MSNGPLHNVKLLFQIGSLIGAAAGVLMPYRLVFSVLLAIVCLLWLTGCLLGRKLRREFAAAQKYLVFDVLLAVLNAFLQSDSLQTILLLAMAMLFYFAAALQCSGIAALAELQATDARVRKLPDALAQFEYAMIIFVIARMIGISASGFTFICDLVGMAAMVVGFFALWRYFGGVRK